MDLFTTRCVTKVAGEPLVNFLLLLLYNLKYLLCQRKLKQQKEYIA